MRRREFVEAAALALTSACHLPPPAAAMPVRPLDAEGYRAARRFAATRSGQIAYIDRGRGPAALFLHGYPLNAFQWRGAIDRLSPERRCIAADFMGLGYSDIPADQGVAPIDQVAMLAALLDVLHVRTVDLVANDSGGAVAQLFATHHPERVRTILFTNCDVENDSPPASLLPLIRLAHAGTLADRSVVPQLADKNVARSARGIGGLAYTFPGDPTDEAIDYYFTPLVRTPLRKRQFEAYAIALEVNPLAGIESKLRTLRTPVRVVWGTGDTVFSQHTPEYLASILPDFRGTRRVDGAKLFFPEEFPDVIAQEARRLWRGE